MAAPLRRSRRIALMLASVAIAGFAPGLSSPARAAEDLSGLCPEMSVQDGLPLCTRFYPGKHWIHVPADPDADHVYGGFGPSRQFWTSAGSRLRIPFEIDPTFSVQDSDGRWHSTLYLATLTNGVVTGLEPRALITDQAFLDRMHAGRAWEGLIHSYHPQPNDVGVWQRPYYRVRIEFQTHARRHTLHGLIEHSHYAGSEIGVLRGRIVNAYTARRSASGRCLPAIGKLPFSPLIDGLTGRLELRRLPGMHEPGDAHLVIEWRGGKGSPMGPDSLMGTLADAMGVGSRRPGTWAFDNHTDWRGEGPGLMNLHRVERGGQRC